MNYYSEKKNGDCLEKKMMIVQRKAPASLSTDATWFDVSML